MIKCRQCLTKAEPRDGKCPVCGMDPEKKRRNLSPAEKKVRFHARGIRAVAMAHLVIGINIRADAARTSKPTRAGNTGYHQFYFGLWPSAFRTGCLQGCNSFLLSDRHGAFEYHSAGNRSPIWHTAGLSRPLPRG